jgi:hypothetical protein
LIAMLYNEMVVQDINAVKDRCSGMPIAKVFALPTDHPAIQLGALISLMAFQIKFQDNLEDEKDIWVSRYNKILQSRFKNSFNKNFEQYRNFKIDIEQIQEQQRKLSSLEKNDASYAKIQECWGETFSYIMTQPFTEKIDSDRLKALQVLFTSLGKVINLIDAMEDFHADLKAERFNLIHHTEKTQPPYERTWLEETAKKYTRLIINEKKILQRCLPTLNLNESFPLVQNIITDCLDKETSKVFEFMVEQKKNTERTLFNCKDF